MDREQRTKECLAKLYEFVDGFLKLGFSDHEIVTLVEGVVRAHTSRQAERTA